MLTDCVVVSLHPLDEMGSPFWQQGGQVRRSSHQAGPTLGDQLPLRQTARCWGQVSIRSHQADVKLEGAAVIWTITVAIIASSP